MNRTELWQAYVARNPQFAGTGNVTLTAVGLRKLFDQTWDKAEAHGKAIGENAEKLRQVVRSAGIKF